MKKVVLVIMDGIGERKEVEGNAVLLSNMQNLEKLKMEAKCAFIEASGEAVGLLDGQPGNSEVGHMTIGAGRKFSQGKKVVDAAFSSGEIEKSQSLIELINNVNSKNSTFHLCGLLSDGGVHSDIQQLFSLLKILEKNNVKKVRIHNIFDGRDVAPQSALQYIAMLENEINNMNFVDIKIASGGGRMNVIMDRYNADMAMVVRGVECIFDGKAAKTDNSKNAISSAYDNGYDDQYLPAFAVCEQGEYIGKVGDDDSFLLYNYRSDRAIEVSEYIEKNYPLLHFAGMVEYDADNNIPKKYLIAVGEINGTLNEYLIENKVRMFAVSETQKFGHITKYFIGNKSKKDSEKYESYCEIESSDIPFEKLPEMRADEITDTLITAMNSGEYDFLRCNLANGDMVGHTGNLDAAIKACKTVDECVGRIAEACKQCGAILIVTADHGNAEDVGTAKHKKTSHTTNKVPFLVVNYEIMQNANKMKNAECGNNAERGNDAECGNNAECGMQNAEYKIENEQYGNNAECEKNAECGMQNEQCEYNAECEKNAECGMQKNNEGMEFIENNYNIKKYNYKNNSGLSNIAATIVELLGLPENKSFDESIIG